MALDATLVLQAAATITATTNSTAVDLAQGTPMRGLWAAVKLTSISGTAATVAYKIQASSDNTTFSDIAVAVPGTVSAAAVLDIPFTTSLRYVRLVSTVAGTTPSIVHEAYIGQGPSASVLA